MTQAEAPWEYRAPGNALATAVIFTPFWIYYLLATIKELTGSKSEIKRENGKSGTELSI